MTLTREQIRARKDKAIQFTRDIVGDPERAEEIQAESLESYAQRRGFEIANPRRVFMARRKSVAELEAEINDLRDEVGELEQENEDLQSTLDEIAGLAGAEEAEEGDDIEEE